MTTVPNAADATLRAPAATLSAGFDSLARSTKNAPTTLVPASTKSPATEVGEPAFMAEMPNRREA
jgi:hypothetical protein